MLNVAMPDPTYSPALLDMLDEPTLLLRGARVALANDPARALFGRGVEGMDLRLAVRHPEVLDAIARGKRAELEVAGIGGFDRKWKLLLRPAKPDGMFLRFLDLSTQHATEKMRTDFVANASHELRTPLAAILGYAETLADGGEVPEAMRERFARSIHEQARRMVSLIDDLMSLSRIEADRFVRPSGRVDPAALVESAANHARALADQRGAVVETRIGEGLPMVAGDAGQLGQMLDNLVANAIRHGCPSVGDKVTVSAAREGDELVLTVADQGDGVAVDLVPRLTERFYRVDRARGRDAGGTGLGLSLVRQIVERHRGSMRIDSAPGVGMKVVVRLPTVAIVTKL